LGDITGIADIVVAKGGIVEDAVEVVDCNCCFGCSLMSKRNEEF